MIYEYMRIQLNLEPFTTSYHTFFKLAVIICLAITVIMSQMREGQEGRHQPLPPPQPRARWTAFVHAGQKCSQVLFCVLESHARNWFYVLRFRD